MANRAPTIRLGGRSLEGESQRPIAPPQSFAVTPRRGAQPLSVRGNVVE